MMFRVPFVILAMLAAVALAPSRAAAHPHVSVIAKARIVASEGKVRAIEHRWTFDEFYSTFLGQGLDKNNDGKLSREELAELAAVNVESLAEVIYFTVLKSGGKTVEYSAPKEFHLESDGKALTLVYTLPLAEPMTIGKTFSLEVFDPTFFVSFELAQGDDAVMLEGGPAGCKIAITRPKPLAQTPLSKLGEDYWANAGMGAQFATRTIVACP